MPDNIAIFDKLVFHRCQFCGRLQNSTKFWSRVLKQAGDACWLWRGSKNPLGYGVFAVPAAEGRKTPRRYLAHRYTWELLHGRPVKLGYIIMHTCDNPGCVRPDHLREGTMKENAQDMMRKGRGAFFVGIDRKGEANGRHKLTAVQVAQIRSLYRPKSADANQYVLAAQFGVCRSTIRALLSGPNWKRWKQNAEREPKPHATATST